MSSSDAERAVRIRAGWVALVGGTLILAGKFLAYVLTGSSAVFSDAMESIVNVVAAALLLYSIIISARPADRDHPYGHGKVEFFTAGVEGTLIAVAALLILVEAVRELIAGPEIRHLDVGLLIMALLTVGNAALGGYLMRIGQQTGSLALMADGKHVLTDVVTTVGVLLGLGLVRLTGWVWLDPVVAIAVGANILRTGWGLIREAIGGLMDEANPILLDGISSALEEQREPWWIDVHGLRAWRSGATHHVDLHLAVPRFFDADRLHDISEEIEGVIERALQRRGEVIVHFDPCRPRQCSSCRMSDCAVRSAPFEERAPLTLARATRVDEQLETGIPVTEQTG